MRGEVLAGVVGAALLSGCLHPIPLGADPMMPSRNVQVSPEALFEIDWYQPLVDWTMLEFQPGETAQPAIDPDTGRIIVGTRDGKLRCLSPIDGKVEWTLETNSRFFAGATVVDGIVYAPGGDGYLYALHARTGAKKWAYKSGEELVTTPVVTGGKVLVASQSDTLFAIDQEKGEWAWQHRRDTPSGFTVRGTATPVVFEGLVYQGFSDGYLSAIQVSDGAVKWERKLTTTPGNQFLDVDSTVVVDPDSRQIFAASYKDGVYAMDATTGQLAWVTARPGVTALIPRQDTLLVAGDGSVTSLQSSNGKLRWTIDISDKNAKGQGVNAGRVPIVAKGLVITPTATGLVFVDPANGRARQAWNPGKGVTASPARDGSRLYVLSNLGTLFALHLRGNGA